MTTQHKATMSFTDGTPSIEFPIMSGTVGPDVIDIRKLYGQTGKFTYDTGFMSTASCESTVTYIDGDKGQLMYRGYPIEQLATHCEFLEVCYLRRSTRSSRAWSCTTPWFMRPCSSRFAASAVMPTPWPCSPV